MKILLTGGSGFMGRNFIETFKDKFEIYAPASDEMNLMRYESVNRIFKRSSYDAVLHFAARTVSPASTLEADNLIMFKNIQYAAILSGVKKLIVVGDCSDFDRARSLCDISEDSFGELIPTDGHGLSRYLITLLASKDKISTTLRFFSLYGKYADVENNDINRIIAKGVTVKRKIEIEAERKVSSIFVDDAVKIIGQFLEKDLPKGDYNIASPEILNFSQVGKKVKSLAKKQGRDLMCVINDTEELTELTCNTDKLSLLLPSFKFTSHSLGITKTFEHLTKHKSECRPKKQSQ